MSLFLNGVQIIDKQSTGFDSTGGFEATDGYTNPVDTDPSDADNLPI
jgi:hypothetical protein